MFNSEKPSLEDLPSSAQLIRSTVIAAIIAVVILLTVILPAEYAIDPTGIGRMLGLTEMGEIKQELEQEWEEDRQKHNQSHEQSNLFNRLFSLFVTSAYAETLWKDTITLTLAPGDSAEVKLVMAKGAKAEYEWVTDGGRINYDLHAHADGESVDYERGRGKIAGQGKINAPFSGEHGWFWRNRDNKNVVVTLRLSGEYSDIVQSN